MSIISKFNKSVNRKGSKNVVCARAGGANTTLLLAAHFAKRNTKFCGGGKRGRTKIPSPQPPSFLPARAFSLARTCPPKPWRRREARRQFRSKKVRISSNKRTKKEGFKAFFLVYRFFICL